MSDNQIAPEPRWPKDLLERWQEIHKDDWKAVLRPEFKLISYDSENTSKGDENVS